MSSEEPGTDVVTLADDAADAVNSALRAKGLNTETGGLRVSVERGGCAGLSYKVDLTAEPEETDVVCDDDRPSVFVDSASKQYLRGAELTVAETAHGTGFCIDNPNADQQCGCGLSFR